MASKQCTKCQIVKSLDNFGKDKRRKDDKRSWCKDCESEYKYFRTHGCPKPLPLPEPPPGMKRCSGCKKIKPLSDFYDDARNINTGKQSRCKQCFADYKQTPRAKELAKRLTQTEKYKRWRYKYHRMEEYRAKRRAEAKTAKGKATRRKYKHSEKGRASALKYAKSEKGKAQQKRYRQTPKGKAQTRRRVLIRLTRKSKAGGSYTTKQWKQLCAQYDYRCLACGKQFTFEELTVDHVVPISKGGTSNIENLQPLCLSCNQSKGANTTDYRTKKMVWWEQLALF